MVDSKQEYLAIAFDFKHTLRIYHLNNNLDVLNKFFEVRHTANQLAFLPNQFDPHSSNQQLYRDLMHRSVTDLSINLTSSEGAAAHQAFEIHKEHIWVKELEIRQLEHKIVMIVVISDGRVFAYENIDRFPERAREKFRFKIIERQVLRKHYDGSVEEQ